MPFLPEDFVVPEDSNQQVEDEKGKEKEEGEEGEEPYLHVPRQFKSKLPDPASLPSIFFWKKRRIRRKLEEERRDHQKREADRMILESMEHAARVGAIKSKREQMEAARKAEREETIKRKRLELLERLCNGEDNLGVATIYVCNNEECRKEAGKRCLRKHKACGHMCCGVHNEQTCLRCIDPACAGDGYPPSFYPSLF